MDKQTCVRLVAEQKINEDIKQELLSFLNTCDEALTEDQLADFRKILLEIEGRALDNAAMALGLDMSDETEIIKVEEEYEKEVEEIKEEFKQEKQEVEEMLATLDSTLQDINKTEDVVKIQDLQKSIKGE